MKFLYDLAFILFAVLYFPFFLIRLRQEKEKGRLLSQRLGFFSGKFLSALRGKKVIWVHAVSVGEVFAARPLIEKLHSDLSGYQVIVSTVTPTGQAVAKKLFSDIPVIYYPFDTSGCVNRTLSKVRPAMILLMETEIWPNFILRAKEMKIPVGIVNGRLSPRSYKRYLWIRSTIKKILDSIAFFLVQFQWDSDRLQELGVPASAIAVTGNMKFDVGTEVTEEEISSLRKKFGVEGKQKILLAGSTHEGEEQILLETFRKLRFEFPQLKLIIAPRHITRTARIVKLIGTAHFKDQQASSFTGSSIEDVLVLDTMGELKKWYALADLVFVGGSLVKHGGQNPIEAAIFKKPVVFGKHVFNFMAIYQRMSEEKAGLQVFNKNELYDVFRRMLQSPQEAKQMGLRAYELVLKCRGTTQRNADFIEKFLKDEKVELPREEATVAS